MLSSLDDAIVDTVVDADTVAVVVMLILTQADSFTTLCIYLIGTICNKWQVE